MTELTARRQRLDLRVRWGCEEMVWWNLKTAFWTSCCTFCTESKPSVSTDAEVSQHMLSVQARSCRVCNLGAQAILRRR